MGSATLSSLGMSGSSAGSILGAAAEGIGKIMELRQQKRIGKAELRQIDANQQLLSQQAQARAEDLKNERAQQESQARALLAASYGPDAFKSRGSSASAFQREGDRLFRQDLARNQSNLSAQTAGLEAQRSAIKAGMPSTLDYIMAIGGAGIKGYSGYHKGVTPTHVPPTPTLAPPPPPPSASAPSILGRGKRKGAVQFGANWGQPGYGKTWWDR